jgi:hypothetical protein
MGRLAAYVAGEVGCRNHPRPRSLRQRATVMASAIRLPFYKSHSPPSRQRAISELVTERDHSVLGVLRVLKVVSAARALKRSETMWLKRLCSGTRVARLYALRPKFPAWIFRTRSRAASSSASLVEGVPLPRVARE